MNYLLNGSALDHLRDHFKFQTVSNSDIVNCTKKLPNSKVSGIDDISNFHLKLAIHHISPVLTHIMNLSISSCTFPTIWKDHKVIPLHKKGDTLLCANYRPIALLSSISKLLERILFNQIYEYFESNNLFSDNQHGFRQNYSTSSALTQLYERIIDNAENSELSGLLMLDFSSAFDVIKHDFLLKKT